MSRPFLILSYPRSRTAWLSKFLTYGITTCIHEPSLYLKNDEDLVRFVTTQNQGGADTGMAMILDKIIAIEPMPAITLVLRDRNDVEQSLGEIGLLSDESKRILDRIGFGLSRAERMGFPTIQFDALHDEKTCADLFRRCVGSEMPKPWFGIWKNKNVVCDTQDIIYKIRRNADGIARVYGNHAALP